MTEKINEKTTTRAKKWQVTVLIGNNFHQRNVQKAVGKVCSTCVCVCAKLTAATLKQQTSTTTMPQRPLTGSTVKNK